MKILLLNVHSFHNAGDFAITLESLKQLYRLFPDSHITIAMNDPDSYAKKNNHHREVVVPSLFTWFRSSESRGFSSAFRTYLMAPFMLMVSIVIGIGYRFGRTSWLNRLPEPYRSTVTAYCEADLVVSVGGNFIYSRGHKAGLPLLSPLFMIAYATVCGKPMYMLPQTIGPLEKFWERLAVGVTLGLFRRVLVRDPQSMEVIRRLPIEVRDVILCGDLAFAFSDDREQDAVAFLDRYDVPRNMPLLGITLIDWGSQYPPFKKQGAYELAVELAAEHFVKSHDGHVVIFSQVCGPTAADDDRHTARRIHRRLVDRGLHKQVHLIDEELDPYKLRSAYGEMDLFLGSRLHSNIFALAQGVPVIAIAYQDKTVGVMRMLGLDEWCVRIEDVDGESLIDLVGTLWTQRHSIAEHIRAEVARMRGGTDTALDTVRQDYLLYKQGWK